MAQCASSVEGTVLSPLGFENRITPWLYVGDLDDAWGLLHGWQKPYSVNTDNWIIRHPEAAVKFLEDQKLPGKIPKLSWLENLIIRNPEAADRFLEDQE